MKRIIPLFAAVALSACIDEPAGPATPICSYADFAAGEQVAYRLNEGGVPWRVVVDITKVTSSRTFIRVEEQPLDGSGGSATVTEFDEHHDHSILCGTGFWLPSRVRMVLGLHNNWGERDAQDYGTEACGPASRDTDAGHYTVNRCVLPVETRIGTEDSVEEFVHRGGRIPGNGLIAKTVRPGAIDEWSAVLESWNGR